MIRDVAMRIKAGSDGLPASTGLVSAPTLRKAPSASPTVAYPATRARLLPRHNPQERTIDNRSGARGRDDFSFGFLLVLCQTNDRYLAVLSAENLLQFMRIQKKTEFSNVRRESSDQVEEYSINIV